MSRQLRLYAHRGCSSKLPENTIPAFRRGLDDGATALELDLRWTADGRVVVFHDADGARTAGDARQVRDLDLATIRQWDLGPHLRSTAGAVPPADGGPYRVSTFEEVLRELPEVPITADVKDDEPRAIPALLELLADAGAAARVTVASFHDHLVHQLRRLGYPGPTALTRGEVGVLRLLPAGLARRLVRGHAAEIPRRHRLIRLDGRGFLRRCRRLGLRADYWVVNDPAAARALFERGATGVMTDDPRRLAHLFADLPCET